MSTFTIKPRFRELGYDYNAHIMIIEAQTQNEALETAKNSSLGRFDNWTFHVEPFNQKKIHKGFRAFIDMTDKTSRSQEGKRINKMELSRPQRRALRRTQMGNYTNGCKPTTKFKCW